MSDQDDLYSTRMCLACQQVLEEQDDEEEDGFDLLWTLSPISPICAPKTICSS
jgi:hypothetical protein